MIEPNDVMKVNDENWEEFKKEAAKDELYYNGPGDLATVYSSPDKSAELLGWKAEYDLDDMCRDTWAWQSKNPMGYES